MGGTSVGVSMVGASTAGVFAWGTVAGGTAVITGVTTTIAVTGGVVAVAGVAVGGAVAAIEIADGWSDGEVCNRVRKAAQKAGLKPKHFLKDGKNYQVVEQYALDDSGNQLIYGDGTAVIAYTTRKGKGACPAALEKQIVPN